MQRIICTIVTAVALFALTACVEPMYQQQYAIQQPPTVTQIQGQCLSKFKQFAAQVDCISNGVNAINLPTSAGIQEYLLLTQSLKEKVDRKTMSGSDARLKLAAKLSEIKAIQDREDTIQQQLEYQRAAQNGEILRQYQSNIIRPEPYQPVKTYQPVVRPHIQTSCQASGNQVNCTTR